jgi:hypothetical protein
VTVGEDLLVAPVPRFDARASGHRQVLGSTSLKTRPEFVGEWRGPAADAEACGQQINTCGGHGRVEH